MYTIYELTKMKDEIMSQMLESGLPLPKNNIANNVTLNRRATAYAVCNRRGSTFTVSVSQNALNIDSTAMRNVICHELIHTLPNCFNHGAAFKRYASIMNNKYGYNVLTRGATDKDGEQAKMEVNYKYKVVCQKCGHVYGHNRLCNVVKYPSHYRCACGGELKSYQLR